MVDEVGTSCATTNATPETSFATPEGWMPRPDRQETGRYASLDVFVPILYAPNAPVYALWRAGLRRPGWAGGGPRAGQPSAASWARTCFGRSVIIASTPSRAHNSTSSGSSTVHTWTSFPARCARSTYSG
jgi:hypothetical protein